jgi:hypothetical protein
MVPGDLQEQGQQLAFRHRDVEPVDVEERKRRERAKPLVPIDQPVSAAQ